MSDADKFLQQLEQLNIKGREKRLELRKRYKEAKETDPFSLDKVFYGYINMKDEEASRKEPEIRAYARALMEVGVSGKDYTEMEGKTYQHGPSARFNFAFRGARLYEKIGKGKNAIPRLLKATEMNRGGLGSASYEQVKSFIVKNAKKKPKTGGLESRVGIFILSTLGGIALSISSLTQTGSAISNLTQTTPGLLGLIFFIAGLAGLVFSRKR